MKAATTQVRSDNATVAITAGASYPERMSKVEEIKTQIDALTWQERCELNAMLQSWPDDEWDRQMATEGKFDCKMEEAGRESSAGQCRDWPNA